MRQSTPRTKQLLNESTPDGSVTGLQFPKPNSTARYEQSLAAIVGALEGVCRRLESSIDHQNQRLRNIEHCLADTLACRFDRLIDVNALISENVRKMVEVSLRAETRREMAMNTQAIDAEEAEPTQSA